MTTPPPQIGHVYFKNNPYCKLTIVDVKCKTVKVEYEFYTNDLSHIRGSFKYEPVESTYLVKRSRFITYDHLNRFVSS